MSIASLIVSLALATAVPGIVLFILYTRDLYESGKGRVILLCFIWGGLMVGAAYVLNTELYGRIGDIDKIIRFGAPIIEEILKGIILVILVRRQNFTYFVDGAIYGFAVGIGFAVAENYFYLYLNQDQALSIAVGRVLSTNLMHATASAIIGSALGFARFQRFRARPIFLVGGLLIAIAFHMGFNNITQSDVSSAWLLIYAVVIGFGGTGFIILVIRRGLQEQRVWIQESFAKIDQRVVTKNEAAVVDHLANAESLLEPLKEVYGEETTEKIEKFLVLQAQLGIKLKTIEKLSDEKMKAAVEKEVARMQAEMEQLRREIGSHIMVSLRIIFPEATDLIRDKLASVTTSRAKGSSSLFASLDKRTGG